MKNIKNIGARLHFFLNQNVDFNKLGTFTTISPMPCYQSIIDVLATNLFSKPAISHEKTCEKTRFQLTKVSIAFKKCADLCVMELSWWRFKKQKNNNK